MASSGEHQGDEGGEQAAEPTAATATSKATRSAEPAAAPATPPAQGARWAEPVARFEARWTWVETRLITFVLLWQLAALTAWVVLNGVSESVSGSAGGVFRAAFAGIGLGTAAWVGGQRFGLDLGRRRALTLLALGLGITLTLLARSLVLEVVAFQKPATGAPPPLPPGALALGVSAFDKATADYFDNIKGWLQGGSTLTLMGGLRGLGTRLTLWLALLGGSLATGAGKHIHIDVIYRFLPKRLRVTAAIVNYAAATLVCTAGAWGFFDHIAIQYYDSRADDARGAKVVQAFHHLSDHLFLTRKQLGLDLRSLPHVLGGERYDRWMTAAEWNRWLEEADFMSHFPRAEVEALRVPEDSPAHAPLVLSPSGETTPGMLAHTLGLVFPFGLLAIALRFLIRAVLTLSGHLSVDPNEARKEDLRGSAITSDASVTRVTPEAEGTEGGA